jgi:hypothetical protein
MKRALHLFSAIVGLLAASLSAGPHSAAEASVVDPAPPAEEIVIDIVTANGTGCPPGTAAITTAAGNAAFTVTYARYTARIGVGAAVADFRKNCQLNVIVRVPQGFAYGISKIDHHGFGSLATGAGAVHRAIQYYKGQTQSAYTNSAFTGPMEDDWRISNEVPAEAMVWSPCGVVRNLNINTELRLTAGTSDTRTTTSLITMDSAVHHLSWTRCP